MYLTRLPYNITSHTDLTYLLCTFFFHFYPTLLPSSFVLQIYLNHLSYTHTYARVPYTFTLHFFFTLFPYTFSLHFDLTMASQTFILNIYLTRLPFAFILHLFVFLTRLSYTFILQIYLTIIPTIVRLALLPHTLTSQLLPYTFTLHVYLALLPYTFTIHSYLLLKFLFYICDHLKFCVRWSLENNVRISCNSMSNSHLGSSRSFT